jgi:hypothetical protein
MPRMDSGPTDGPPSAELTTVWVTLTPAEADELLSSLLVWAEEAAEGQLDPSWHTHVRDQAGNELTIAIAPEDNAD